MITLFPFSLNLIPFLEAIIFVFLLLLFRYVFVFAMIVKWKTMVECYRMRKVDQAEEIDWQGLTKIQLRIKAINNWTAWTLETLFFSEGDPKLFFQIKYIWAKESGKDGLKQYLLLLFKSN